MGVEDRRAEVPRGFGHGASRAERSLTASVRGTWQPIWNPRRLGWRACGPAEGLRRTHSRQRAGRQHAATTALHEHGVISTVGNGSDPRNPVVSRRVDSVHHEPGIPERAGRGRPARRALRSSARRAQRANSAPSRSFATSRPRQAHRAARGLPAARRVSQEPALPRPALAALHRRERRALRDGPLDGGNQRASARARAPRRSYGQLRAHLGLGCRARAHRVARRKWAHAERSRAHPALVLRNAGRPLCLPHRHRLGDAQGNARLAGRRWSRPCGLRGLRSGYGRRAATSVRVEHTGATRKARGDGPARRTLVS